MIEDPDDLLDMILSYWRSQIVYTGVVLDVFEAVGDAPRSSDELAGNLDLHPPFAYRLFRALASLNLLEETEYREFVLTEFGSMLREEHPRSLRGVVLLEDGPEHFKAWRTLPELVREGGKPAFEREFGESVFEHIEEDPDYGRRFDEGMTGFSKLEVDAVISVLKNRPFDSHDSICDVGGGRGYMIARLLEEVPHLSGQLLERPNVLEDPEQLWPGRRGIEDRCQYVVGDMFESVPSADVYLLKRILHDWTDEECRQILSTLHQDAPSDASLYLLESVVPEPGESHYAKVFDLHMMCATGGRERTEPEYRRMLEETGWEPVDLHRTETQVIDVLEAVRAPE